MLYKSTPWRCSSLPCEASDYEYDGGYKYDYDSAFAEEYEYAYVLEYKY